MSDSSYPPKDSFHWQDNIFFTVNEHYGLVECFRHDGNYHHIWAMSLQSWDSIVAFIARNRDRDGDASVDRSPEGGNRETGCHRNDESAVPEGQTPRGSRSSTSQEGSN